MKTKHKKTPKESKTTPQSTQVVSTATQELNLSFQYMTPQDLERELGISLQQQYKLRSARFRKLNAEKGRTNLPYIKQMGLIVYDRNDVIKWLNSNKKS